MIAEALVADIADKVAGQGLDEAALTSLRAAYPDVHFTYCSDDDILAGRPVEKREGFNVYLVDGRDHCMCLTADFDAATGLVLAYVVDDEE